MPITETPLSDMDIARADKMLLEMTAIVENGGNLAMATAVAMRLVIELLQVANEHHPDWVRRMAGDFEEQLGKRLGWETNRGSNDG